MSTFVNIPGPPFLLSIRLTAGTLVILVHKKIKLLRLGGIVAALQLKLYAFLSIRFFYFCFDIKNLWIYHFLCVFVSFLVFFCTWVRNFCTWFGDFCIFGVGGYAGRPCVICIFPAGSFSACCCFRIGGLAIFYNHQPGFSGYSLATWFIVRSCLSLSIQTPIYITVA